MAVVLFGGGDGGFFASRNVQTPLEEQDAATIYQRAVGPAGTRPLGTGPPPFFIEVERLHPYSEWASRALIMAAFA